MRKRFLKKILVLGVGFLIALFIAYAPGLQSKFDISPPQMSVAPGTYHITYFSDGDTFSVEMNGREERVRLIGVDTPETHKPNSPQQCYGKEASQYTKQLVGQQSVRLEADPTNDNRDRYDRLLRYAYLPDGTLVNQKIIDEGYGFAYTSFPFTKRNDFVGSQIGARNASKGLWAACEFTEKKGRFQTNNLTS